MRTIIKAQNKNTRDLIKEHFDNNEGTMARNSGLSRDEGIALGLQDGLELGTIYADDRNGIRRRWTVIAYQVSGSMRDIHKWGFWGLQFTSHQTKEEIDEQERWLQSRGA